MSTNRVLLELDTTGTNINNRITNEPHTLSGRKVRSIATHHGPFFADSLVIRDGARQLDRGTDFQIVELHQEATLLYGKEIASVALIINSAISTTVTVSYQALGGHFAYSNKAIANLYETVIKDNRSVDWTNVFNKPTEFNPTIHRHLLDDVFGFEPIVDHLERIKRAITLGQTSVVLEIINSLLSKFECKELPKILPSNKLVQYDALLFFLSRRKILNNIWVDVRDCNWVKGNSYTVEIDTTGYPANTTLFWEFYKPDLNVGLFSTKSGEFRTNNGIVQLQIYVPAENNVIEHPLYIGIKEQPTDIDYKAVTYIINVREHNNTTEFFPYLSESKLHFANNTARLHTIAQNDELRLYYTLTTY